jgi:hypothetical protein
MSFVFPTNASQVQAFAGALYGVQVGTTTMAQVNNDIAANGGLAKTLNSYYAATFGSVATATVASTVAANLGLTGAALTSGTAYITAQLNAAAADARGAVISNIVNLFGTLSADATFGAAATAWNAKVATAVSYTGASNVAVGSTVNQGTVFTLTNDVEDATGTAGNDTFNALSANDPDVDTFNTGDLIDGGAGTDTLNITVRAGGTEDELVEIINVENINIRKLDVGDNFDATLWDGVERITSVRSADPVGVDEVQNNVIIGATNTDADLEVTFADDALDSDEATIAMAVSDADDILVTVNVGGDDAVVTLTIEASGESIVEVDGDLDALTSLSVTGTGSLELTNADGFADVTEVDLSGNSGGVTLDITDATLDSLTGGSGDDVITVAAVAEDASIDLGAGDDILTADAGDLDDAAEVKGGAGTDTISSVALNNVNRTIFSGFETLALAGEDRSIDVSRFTNNTFSNLLIDDDLGGATAISRLAGSTINIDVVTTTTATLTATLATATGTSDVANVTFTDDAAGATLAGLTTAGVETLNIVSGGDGANQISALTLTDNTLSKIVITGDEDFTIAAPTTNTTAVASTTAAAASVAALSLIDGSEATGDLTITGPTRAAYSFTTNGTFYHTYTTTIKTGSGDDTVTTGATATTTVYTNDGDDGVTLNGTAAIAYLGEGADTVSTSGAGQTVYLGADEDIDALTLVAATSATAGVTGPAIGFGATYGSTSRFLTVNDFNEGDTIDVDDIFAGADVDGIADETNIADGELTFAAAVNAVRADLGWNDEAAYFHWDGDTYIVVSSNTDWNTTDANAQYSAAVIKLIGEVDLDMADSIITLA